MSFFEKQVNDPVHGVVGLSKLETELISSRAFQRLHNIKQLGLGALVYPGANYSRFSHSIGACHIAGQMLDAIGRKGNIDKWSIEAKIPKELWYVWSVPLGITKMGSTARVDRGFTLEEATKDEELRSQLIWIKGLDPRKPNAAGPITSAQDTLVNTLSNKQFYGLRVYVNLANLDLDKAAKQTEINRIILRDMPELIDT